MKRFYGSTLNAACIVFSTLFLACGIYLADQHYGENRDLRPEIVQSLPGPNNQISPGSIKNIEALLANKEHVLGVWVAKLNYTKHENPIIWFNTSNYEVESVIKNYAASQLSGRGTSSIENDKSDEQKRILRNTTRSKQGQVVCGSLNETSLPSYSPNIVNVARSVCRATIPPFSDDVNLVIIVVTDIQGSDDTSSVHIRRTLLQLQLDIFNRDYLNREVPILNNPDQYIVSQN